MKTTKESRLGSRVKNLLIKAISSSKVWSFETEFVNEGLTLLVWVDKKKGTCKPFNVNLAYSVDTKVSASDIVASIIKIKNRNA
jgi:hypothetical protein